MKKWSNPEFLNLNLHETKQPGKPVHNGGGIEGTSYYHKCRANGTEVDCLGTHENGYDKCSEGHTVTEWINNKNNTYCIKYCCGQS